MTNHVATAAAAGEAPAIVQPEPAVRPSIALAVWTLWRREFRGFYRQRARVIAGLATPLIFWLALGSGFGNSMQTSTGGGYLEYFFPGTVMLVVLFASIFSNISLIEDRSEGFLLSVLASPTPRWAMALGRILGATTIGLAQGAVLLPLAPLLGMTPALERLPGVVAMLGLTAFSLTAMGFYFAWKLNSVQGFHAVMNTALMPMWLLSGALFPIDGASGWMVVLMKINPLTYGVTGLRRMLLDSGATAAGPSLATCWAVTLGFAVAAFAAAAWTVSRPSAEHLS